MSARAVARRARIAVRHAALPSWISQATTTAASSSSALPSTSRSYGSSVTARQQFQDSAANVHDEAPQHRDASSKDAPSSPVPAQTTANDGQSAGESAASDSSVRQAGPSEHVLATAAPQQSNHAAASVAEDVFKIRAPAASIVGGATPRPVERAQFKSSDLRLGVKMESSLLQARETTRAKQEKQNKRGPAESGQSRNQGPSTGGSRAPAVRPNDSEVTTRIRSAIIAEDWKAAEAAVLPTDSASLDQVSLLNSPNLDLRLVPKEKSSLLDLFTEAVDKQQPCLNALIVLTNHALRTCDTTASSADQLIRWVQLVLRLDPTLDLTSFALQFGDIRKQGPHLGLDFQLAKSLVLCLLSSAARLSRSSKGEEARTLAKREAEFVMSLARGQARLRRSSLHQQALWSLIMNTSKSWPKEEALKEAVTRTKELLPVLDAVWGLDGEEPGSEMVRDEEHSTAAHAPPLEEASNVQIQGAPVRNALARRFGALVETKSWNAVDDLGKGARRAIEMGFLTHHTGDRGTSNADWTDTTSAIQIRSLLQLKRPQEAAMAWDTHVRASGGDRPSALVWSGLLSGYLTMGNWEAMRATWDSMKGQERDSHGLTTMISGLFRARLVDEALGLFDQYRRSSLCVIATYNAVLHGLATHGQISTADLLFNDMLAGPEHLRPNQGSFNTLLRANARRQDLRSVSKTLEQMDAAGVAPDVVTFTTILDGLLRAGHPNATKDVMNIIKETGVELNAQLVTALIRCTLFDQTPITAQSEGLDVLGSRDENASGHLPRAREALLMLLDMERHGPAPTGITYTAIMSGLGKMQLADFARCMKTFPATFAKSVPQRFKAESTDVLGSIAQVAPQTAFMLKLRDHMRNRSFIPSRAQNHIVLDSLLMPRWTREALLDASLARLINDAQQLFDQRAISLLKAMMERNGGMDVPSYRTWLLVLRHLIDRLRSGDPSAASKLHKALEMYGRGQQGKVDAEKNGGVGEGGER
ncbi:FOG: PPR repeat [Ceraceosorus bombacis]|uniref:FOG: PPR repeat n=1 Tax=Ceraceosorus bombacis TaxID=401625 RepID=A0A0P1BAB1_9BASI|nr:FOG: PPR repeat [Ceraceosorus bombacis]